ncbi:MAG: membrane protein insertion efficiency factor YidD [Synergistaceae bacterium]|nr:membrane protein insertion efficiency factor YidD [Synergistaceae bacterium]
MRAARVSAAARIAVGLVRGYQLCISPFLGKRCRFYPSCSQYAILALTEWGFFRGLWLAARRLAKCGPWHEGGVDPVPAREPAGEAKNGRE